MIFQLRKRPGRIAPHPLPEVHPMPPGAEHPIELPQAVRSLKVPGYTSGNPAERNVKVSKILKPLFLNSGAVSVAWGRAFQICNVAESSRSSPCGLFLAESEIEPRRTDKRT